jgi:hypothetical protein
LSKARAVTSTIKMVLKGRAKRKTSTLAIKTRGEI